MEEIAIIGVGLHAWGKFPEKPWTSMAAEAATDALADAGIAWNDVQAVVSGSQNWGGRKGIYSGNYFDEVMGYNGVPTVNVNNACATGGTCITVAAAMVASGSADVVLAVSADKSPKGFFPFLPTYHEEPVPSDDTLRWLMGLPNPIYWALECRRMMRAHGVTDEHLAQVKVATSKHGALNPMARYRKEFTLDEVLASPMVTDPLRLFEICATSDGAGAVVLCTVENANRYTSRPITIAAAALGSPLYGDPTTRIPVMGYMPKDGVPVISESHVAARRAYELAGIGPEDVDFVEVPDNSSWHYLQYLETMGFFAEGEAHLALERGDTVVGGKLPVCPSGGFSSFGEATMAQGFAQVYEMVLQLRGQCGARQVEGARVGMSEVYGMAGNNAALILKS
ncbi:MAG TPA: transporter [Thermoleophilia bacterium]|nr:transporter [Thermoleophilia bacterium]